MTTPVIHTLFLFVFLSDYYINYLDLFFKETVNILCNIKFLKYKNNNKLDLLTQLYITTYFE